MRNIIINFLNFERVGSDMMATEAEADLLERWIQQQGCAVSEAILDSSCHIFRMPGVEGFIGYKIESSCAVAIGDPVCQEKDMPLLANGFYEFCRQNEWHMIYIITSEKFSNWALQNFSLARIEMGEELIFNPQLDPTLGSESSKLRNYINHSRHLGLNVMEYSGNDPGIERAILEMGRQWKSGRRGPQMHLGNLDFFSYKLGKRWFYISHKEKIIGMAMITRLDACQGWLLKYLMALQESPRGTSELLMATILATLKKEGCQCLTYGIVPADKLGEISGLSKFSTWSARKLFSLIKWLFKLEQRKFYWKKFKPTAVPSYTLIGDKRVGLAEIKAIIKAMQIEFL